MTLVLALAMEWFIGDPSNRWHPVAWFGRWVVWCESYLYGDSRSHGVVSWMFVLGVPCALALIGHSLLGRPFDVLLLWLSIGWKSLFEHVKAVLNARLVKDARVAVSMIVSRDTSKMTREDTRRAALESLAENASDAVVAPLFWFALLGPLGAVIYRMVNTMDAMWGYRNDRYENFGWCAAKVDDIANWIPARITARLILWMGNGESWLLVGKQAATHASPNAGWPETALAFSANIRLGGSVVRDHVIEARPWYGRDDFREIDATAVQDALNIVRNSLIIASILTLGVYFVF